MGEFFEVAEGRGGSHAASNVGDGRVLNPSYRGSLIFLLGGGDILSFMFTFVSFFVLVSFS